MHALPGRRILVLEGCPSSKSGGAEQSMRRFCEYLALQHSVFIAYALSGNYVDDPALAGIYSKTIQVNLEPVSFNTLFRIMHDFIRLRRFVRENEIDLILTHQVGVSPVLRVLRFVTGIPYGIYYKWTCSMDDVGLKVRWGNAGVSCAGAVCRYVARYWIQNGILESKIRVIPEGVKNYKGSLNFHVSRNVFSVGFAGRLVPEKGLCDLLRAISILRTGGNKVELRVAGSFDYKGIAQRDEFQAIVFGLIEKLNLGGCVTFDGFVEPLEPWLAARDVVVVPSQCQEAQATVMMQSMIVGTPVIATRVGGIPEVLSGEFETLLIPPNDPDAMAACLHDLIQDENRRRELGKELRKLCQSSYTIEDQYYALDLLLRDVVA